ncbi:MAG: hypothetical protein ACRD9W_02050, partial [Terriglobia bacterium]
PFGRLEFLRVTDFCADLHVPRREPDHVYGYYLRDDGELMIEVKPGEFVTETAARSGLLPSSILTDISRIKGRLGRLPRATRKPRS